MTPQTALRPRRPTMILIWALFISFDTAFQLLMKTAGSGLAMPELSTTWILAAAGSIHVWLAVLCYLGTFGLWMLVLHRSELTMAFPATALTYIGVVVGSRWLLHEQIHLFQYVGIALIVCGVASLGKEDHQAPNASHPPI